MSFAGWFEIVLTLALVFAAAYPIGAFMADVFDNRRTFLTPILGPVERALYRLAGVNPEVEQKWPEYAISMVVFGGGCLFALYALAAASGLSAAQSAGLSGRAARSRLQHRDQLHHQRELAGLWRGDDAQPFVSDGRPHRQQFPRFGGGDRDRGRADPGAGAKRVADDRQLLGRYDARDALHPVAALACRRIGLRGAGRAANPQRVGRGDDARRRETGHFDRPGRQPGGDQAPRRQRRRLLQRQFRPSLRKPERLVEYASELEPTRAAGRPGVRVRAHGRRLAARTRPAHRDDCASSPSRSCSSTGPRRGAIRR